MPRRKPTLEERVESALTELERAVAEVGIDLCGLTTIREPHHRLRIQWISPGAVTRIDLARDVTSAESIPILTALLEAVRRYRMLHELEKRRRAVA